MSETVRRRLGAAVTLAALAVVVVGLFAPEDSDEDRVAALATRLRCPVCQSESIADSGSQTARDSERLIAELVAEGRTDQEIVDFFVARYGEWILLDPPATGRGLLLWLLPAAGLVAGVGAILGLRRRAPASP
ncbi:MAG: cytochrome c-type biogenesis protein [Acidimicrobiia bacterium]|nr:cytochrome c-type biogenesis protein [Acidimicrobiia bacterium]